MIALGPVPVCNGMVWRWYDPSVGRWMSQDPIGFHGDPSNVYRYVNNSPTNWIDPFGLQGCPKGGPSGPSGPGGSGPGGPGGGGSGPGRGSGGGGGPGGGPGGGGERRRAEAVPVLVVLRGEAPSMVPQG